MTKEITKEQWDECVAEGPYGKYVKKEKYGDLFSAGALFGNGVYGVRPFQRDGKYYIMYDLGSSCD